MSVQLHVPLPFRITEPPGQQIVLFFPALAVQQGACANSCETNDVSRIATKSVNVFFISDVFSFVDNNKHNYTSAALSSRLYQRVERVDERVFCLLINT